MKVIINCDGGSRGNPGPAALGYVLWDTDRNILEKKGEFLGTSTNNVAEYTSLIKSLQAAQTKGATEVEVYMDSELVVKQVLGEYRVKAVHLKELYLIVTKLKDSFSVFTISHVRRNDEYQQHADLLVNQAMDLA